MPFLQLNKVTRRIVVSHQNHRPKKKKKKPVIASTKYLILKSLLFPPVAMDSYTPLLEKTRIPQPSLQKLAIVSIFEKFRSAPPSDAGRDAISRCLRSASAAVVDQSTRELCRLVKDAKFDVSGGLLELQSALEDSSNPQFTVVFVKAIGLLTRLGFERNPESFRFSSSENHPFVKVWMAIIFVL